MSNASRIKNQNASKNPDMKIGDITSPAQTGKAEPKPAGPLPTVQDAPKPRFSQIVEQIRAQAREQLKSHFVDFLEGAIAEEVLFMNNVMEEWDGRHNYMATPNRPLEREIPIFSAIQYQLNQKHLVEVPDYDMIPAIQHFIEELDRASYRKKPGGLNDSDAVITERVEKRTRGEFELFIRTAGRPSLDLLGDVMARWNDLHRDPAIHEAVEAGKLTNLLAVAVEMVMEHLLVTEAVKSATA